MAPFLLMSVFVAWVVRWMVTVAGRGLGHRVQEALREIPRRGVDRGPVRLGLAGMVISCAGYLVPSVAVIAAVRILHGTAWAAFNTGANATLADLAPATRRGRRR